MKNVEKTKASVSVNLELELDVLMRLHEVSGVFEGGFNKVVEDACNFYIGEDGIAEEQIILQVLSQMDTLEDPELVGIFKTLNSLGFEIKPIKNFNERNE